MRSLPVVLAVTASAIIAACSGGGAEQGASSSRAGCAAGAVLEFMAPSNYQVGTGSWYALDSDFNRDGRRDLAVINAGAVTGAGGLSVLMNATAPGAEAAQFLDPVKFTTGASPQALGLADIDGDGLDDLLVGNWLGSGLSGVLPGFLLPSDGALSVLLNRTPAGADRPQFAPKVDFRAGPGTGGVAAADFNRDGRIDIATTNFNTPGRGGLSVLLNRTPHGGATPEFSDTQFYDVGAAPIGLQAKDINGDGKPDLVVGNSLGFTVSVLVNRTADGATEPDFATPLDFAVGSFGNGPETLDLEDINGDGRLDIVSPHFFTLGPGVISILVNTTPPGGATPSFAAQVVVHAGIAPEQVILEDMDGDGRRDIVVANFGEVSTGRAVVPGLPGVSVLLNRTTPGSAEIDFAPRQDHAAGSGPAGIVASDLNNDGRLDLAVANMLALGGGLSVLMNQGCAQAP